MNSTPILLFRKPFSGTVAENVLRHGTGALNVDGCRIEGVPRNSGFVNPDPSGRSMMATGNDKKVGYESPSGRWPANVILSDDPEVLAGFPETHGAGYAVDRSPGARGGSPSDVVFQHGGMSMRHGDSGSVARFFKQCPMDTEEEIQSFLYCAKASKRDRDDGCDWMEGKAANGIYGDGLNTDTKVRTDDQRENGVERELRKNVHPTVKPTELMRWLCKLVTPPGGVILDPFMGSGSTGKGAVLEGFRFVGVEMNPEYKEIAEARIAYSVSTVPVKFVSRSGEPKVTLGDIRGKLKKLKRDEKQLGLF